MKRPSMMIALAGGLLALAVTLVPHHTAAQRAPQDRDEIRLSFAPIVKQASPAVVNVYASKRARNTQSPFMDDPFFRRFFEGSPFGMPRGRARSSLGSGVIVDPDGVIVTNNHVISGADEVKIAFADGQEYKADIVLRDDRTDLAILRIRDGEGDYPVLDFADSDEVEVGDLVLAIGNPFGVGQTVTSGIVSAIARTDVGINDLAFFIQTDAAINPGNSGGALVDLNGEVVGINTAIFSRSGGSNGIGFAIPSNMVRSVVTQALRGFDEIERPWVGAIFQRMTTDIARSLDLRRPVGALVVRVQDDSPAGRAGLKVGDLVMRVNGVRIANPSALEYRLALLGIGNQAELRVLRRGAWRNLSLDLEPAPETVRPDLREIGGRSPLAGLTVANLSPRLATKMRVPPHKEGVVVVDVGSSSKAARYGFRKGDIVLRAQGRDIETTRDLEEVAERRSRVWRLRVDRRGRVSNIVIGG